MSWQVPLPARDGDDFNAALSLRSSAHDLARFAVGFINGDLIGVSARARMVDERIEVSGPVGDRAGAGLGFYTRERMDGLTIWQSSANIGLRGLQISHLRPPPWRFDAKHVPGHFLHQHLAAVGIRQHDNGAAPRRLDHQQSAQTDICARLDFTVQEVTPEALPTSANITCDAGRTIMGGINPGIHTTLKLDPTDWN